MLVAVAFLASLSGCHSRGNNGTIANLLTSRDCRQEYNQLSVEEYHDLYDAKTAMRSFLADFDDKSECFDCCGNVQQMEAEFANMDNLFSDVDLKMPKEQYCAFVTMVNSNSSRFSGSSFEAVRNTWAYLVKEKKDYYLRERLDLIDQSEFTPHLISFAKELAEDWYGGGGPTGWVVKNSYVLNNAMSPVNEVEGVCAKRCSCTVHVDMEGAMGLGLRSGSVEILVEGTLDISGSGCNVVFAKGGYEKGKVEGGLKRRELLN